MTALIRFADLLETPWANGAGRKAEIAAGPGWSLAFAWLERAAPFSDYAGWNRTITLVEGDGFALDFAGRPGLVVDRAGRPADFDGAWPAACRLLGGECLVLNAFSEQARFRQRVVVAEPRGIGPLGAGDLAVVLRGQAGVGGVAARARDALRIAGPAAASGSRDALIAVARFQPV